MLIASCTAAVQHRHDDHAPQPCKVRSVAMHGNRATSPTNCDLDHARYPVQHRGPDLALQPCKVSCTAVVQHRKTEPTYVGTDNRSRHALACKTVGIPYRKLITHHLDQLSHRGNQQTACADGPCPTVIEEIE